MIRVATEGSVTWFVDLEASDVPYPLPKGITIHLKQGQVGIEVQGLVGAVPLRNGDTLQITPKIGQINFLRILFLAEGNQKDLEREYDNFVQYSIEDEANLDSVVARQLLVCASEILSRSPLQGRRVRKKHGEFASGQIDPVQTALNLACHKSEPVEYFVRERTVNIPENRVISETVARAWQVLTPSQREDFSKVYDRWMMRFARSTDLEADLEYIERGLATGSYGGARDYYRRALMLSQILLGSRGLGFKDAASVEGDAVLLNTADVFERYLRAVVSNAYSEAGFVVRKGGGTNTLYTDGDFELEPDIVISKGGKTVLIMDAKYKIPTSADHYQMFTYLSVYGVNSGLLVAPNYKGDQLSMSDYLTNSGLAVREVFVPLGNPSVTEDFLETVVEKYS